MQHSFEIIPEHGSSENCFENVSPPRATPSRYPCLRRPAFSAVQPDWRQTGRLDLVTPINEFRRPARQANPSSPHLHPSLGGAPPQTSDVVIRVQVQVGTALILSEPP